ncbi:hypothetical protein [Legionella sp. km772]|uniref:hypothetical protein n=1 Tax=Legionella sp. km772 TaxID=2498111 RepID=UPI0013158F62|nr:hypothetical protein [Legionella sp. km772]
MHLNFLALTKGLYEEPKVVHLTQLIAKESARLRKEASFFERLKVNQFIEQVEKITQAYLIDKNENKFFNDMMKQITKTRDLFNDKPNWQRLFDAFANALIKLFKQSQAYNDFSFFSNQATQETIDKLEIAIKPK